MPHGPTASSNIQEEYDINNPPSVPSTPKVGPNVGYGDVMVPGDYAESRYPEIGEGLGPLGRDQVIDIINGGDQRATHSSPPTPDEDAHGPTENRRKTVALPAEGDVCFPLEGMSEMGDTEDIPLADGGRTPATNRRRTKEWPDLSVLDDWSRDEKEKRSEGIRAKKINEPVLVGGRLRPNNRAWHRTEEDAPYRFTYFNEDFASTIHSQTISELLQPGQTFREFFIPDPLELSDDESEEDAQDLSQHVSRDDHRDHSHQRSYSTNGEKSSPRRPTSALGDHKPEAPSVSGEAASPPRPDPNGKAKRFGSRPTWWLDVLSPTEAEMRCLSKTFGIHPLTAEDILMQEAREKVELFRNYYFVNYRTFEQDQNSEHFLEPVDMYVVCFREGVISVCSLPHPSFSPL
jgi:magnesium transporter